MGVADESKTMARVEVVPWSMARICSGILAVLYRLGSLIAEWVVAPVTRAHLCILRLVIHPM